MLFHIFWLFKNYCLTNFKLYYFLKDLRLFGFIKNFRWTQFLIMYPIVSQGFKYIFGTFDTILTHLKSCFYKILTIDSYSNIVFEIFGNILTYITSSFDTILTHRLTRFWFIVWQFYEFFDIFDILTHLNHWKIILWHCYDLY